MNVDGDDEAAGPGRRIDSPDPRRPDDEDPDSVTLPWAERADRELRDIAATGTISFLLVLAVVSLLRAAVGTPGNQLGAAAFSFALAAAGLFIWYGPMGGVGARASVDTDGLWIRHLGWRLWPTDIRIELSPAKHLPAAEIGQVELVVGQRRRELWRKAVALQYNGRRIGWTRTNLDRHTEVAVMIRQRGERSRPWWLLKCHQCRELVTALELARSEATSASAD